ncbi:MAG: adenylyltransferase [Patescibacteria group bacterium]|nr:adenylyltransferase [Patescibacteria group bacterium]
MTVDKANAEIVPRGDYGSVLQAILDEGICPFCPENLFKHHTKPILFEGPHWLVTENFKPYEGTVYHFVLIPKRHMERIEELDSAEWLEVHEHYRALVAKFDLSGATILWRSGNTKLTGASVVHLHAQIIVGKLREDGTTPITGVVGFKHKGET